MNWLNVLLFVLVFYGIIHLHDKYKELKDLLYQSKEQRLWANKEFDPILDVNKYIDGLTYFILWIDSEESDKEFYDECWEKHFHGTDVEYFEKHEPLWFTQDQINAIKLYYFLHPEAIDTRYFESMFETYNKYKNNPKKCPKSKLKEYLKEQNLYLSHIEHVRVYAYLQRLLNRKDNK